MTNKNERRKVPELRFPEFSGEWAEKKLNNFMTFNNGINASKENYGTGKKFINVLDVLNNDFITYDNIIGKVSVSEKLEALNKVEYGDALFLRSSETRIDVGKANIYLDKEKHALFGGFIIRGKKINDYSPFFMKYLLNNQSTRKQISSKAGGSTRFNVSQSILNDIEIIIPSIDEQQKIGEFFSKLDRQIELEEKKLALLEEQKKGYMQKIFSQELRFKDENGEEYPEWEDLRLGDIFQEVNDKTSINNKYPILSSTNNGLFSQKDYFKHQVASTNNIGYKILKKNQVVLSPQNLWLGNININFKFEEGIVSPSYKIFNIINSNPLFISYILKRPKMLFEYKNASEQGASIVRRNLNLDLFYNIKLRLPSYEEQTSIQNFLSAIENQIDRSDYKIKMLNLRKNYLLNKIFL